MTETTEAHEDTLLDTTQTSTLIDFLVGSREVTADHDGNPYGPHYSAELRAFIIARIGDDAPLSGHDAFTRHQKKGRALANFLRVAANSIERFVGK